MAMQGNLQKSNKKKSLYDFSDETLAPLDAAVAPPSVSMRLTDDVQMEHDETLAAFTHTAEAGWLQGPV